jgi:hypothetical protein
MTDKLTKVEYAALADLESVALQAMRSKPTLNTLSKLEDRGLIQFNPFEGTATMTERGLAAMRACDPS